MRKIIIATALFLALACNRPSPTDPLEPMGNSDDSAPSQTVGTFQPNEVTVASSSAKKKKTPAPVPACESGCNGIITPPDQADVNAMLGITRDAMKNAVSTGALRAKKRANWDQFPAVEWKACWFTVLNASWVENGKQVTGPNCAAGMTDYDRKKIVISTKQPERTLALVRWETVNYYLMSIGRSDLTDSFQSSLPL